MKKISLILLAFCSICFTSCLSDLDNYESPNGGIKGQILDQETKEPIPLPVQGSTGVIINLYEQGTDATQSVDFYAKMDGSYEQWKNRSMLLHHLSCTKCRKSMKSRILLILIIKLLQLMIVLLVSKNRSMLLHFQKNSIAFIAPKNGVCCYSSDDFIILEDY